MYSENPSSKKPLYLRHLHLLPEEIIEEILSRLPVKSVLRFRCVSKSWLSLVESNRFIKIHYQNSSKNTSLPHHMHRVVFNGIRGCFRCYSLQSLLNSNSNSKKGLSSSWNNISISIANPTDKGGVASVRGCINGVLCLLSDIIIPNSGYVCWLWNPATKVVVELPRLIGSLSFNFGFGWDESSGAFKVFATAMVEEDGSYKKTGHVYSSKTNSWKTVPRYRVECKDYLFKSFGVFVCGRIHWAMKLYDEQYVTIMSFKMENDEFERIELPPLYNANANANANARESGDLASRTWLGEIGGCLCTLFHDKKKKMIDVWIMKEYGVKDSWFKRHTFPIADDVYVSRLSAFPPLLGKCGLNGEIFITCCDKLMVYSPNDGDFSKVADLDLYFRAFLYVESLVSPLGITTIRGANT